MRIAAIVSRNKQAMVIGLTPPGTGVMARSTTLLVMCSERVPLRVSLGTSLPKLVDAVTLMEANIEEPLSLDELAGYTSISRRQLERLFDKHLNCTPSRYYLELRLQRARQFLLETEMPIIDIALACGFSSAPHFSKSYRDFFEHAPNAERHRQSQVANNSVFPRSTR